MSAPILDHVVIDVHDEMDAAVRIYARLGFTLTPRGHHTLGSINHLAMFEQNYLELLGFGDGARAELAAFPRGLNGLVFKTDDADATARDAGAAGLAVLPISSFSRPVTLAGETRDARFRTTRLDPARTGLGRIYFCEHGTPELVWRPEWLGHPNGAQTIVRLLIAGDDPNRLGELFARLFGAGAVHRDAGGLTVQAGNAQIVVRTHAAVAVELGGAAPDAAGRADYMAALTFHVAALDATARVLTSMADVMHAAGSLVVPATACGNVALIFTT
jgi:Glyoxalase-like domain